MANIALLGFLPWMDVERGIAVPINPAERAAALCVEGLVQDGKEAVFIPVEVSAQGIGTAMELLRRHAPTVVVALGRTPTAPRVERWGRVPLSELPLKPGEEAPWLLAPDAEELALHLASLDESEAEVASFSVSDDAGAYFCDHLCVELARDARARGTQARFLHVPGVEGCSQQVSDARVGLYVRQARAAVEWLIERISHAS